MHDLKDRLDAPSRERFCFNMQNINTTYLQKASDLFH